MVAPSSATNTIAVILRREFIFYRDPDDDILDSKSRRSPPSAVVVSENDETCIVAGHPLFGNFYHENRLSSTVVPSCSNLCTLKEARDYVLQFLRHCAASQPNSLRQLRQCRCR